MEAPAPRRACPANATTAAAQAGVVAVVDDVVERIVAATIVAVGGDTNASAGEVGWCRLTPGEPHSVLALESTRR